LQNSGEADRPADGLDQQACGSPNRRSATRLTSASVTAAKSWLRSAEKLRLLAAVARPSNSPAIFGEVSKRSG
jgi:hypothetical protein